jgi:uncharacterized protein YecE (DUF72 family)
MTIPKAAPRAKPAIMGTMFFGVLTFEIMTHRYSCVQFEKLFSLRSGYFNKKAFLGVNDFLARLRPFLKKLPQDHKFAVELRNKNWLAPQFVETLRERGVALALIDQSWMPRPTEWFEKFDPITADFTYVRWLGDRKGIEAQTKVWDRVIVDRRAELSEWAEILGKVHKRKIQIFAYANNHYAGFGPATVETFHDLWRRQVKEETKRGKAETLFPM